MEKSFFWRIIHSIDKLSILMPAFSSFMGLGMVFKLSENRSWSIFTQFFFFLWLINLGSQFFRIYVKENHSIEFHNKENDYSKILFILSFGLIGCSVLPIARILILTKGNFLAINLIGLITIIYLLWEDMITINNLPWVGLLSKSLSDAFLTPYCIFVLYGINVNNNIISFSQSLFFILLGIYLSRDVAGINNFIRNATFIKWVGKTTSMTISMVSYSIGIILLAIKKTYTLTPGWIYCVFTAIFLIIWMGTINSLMKKQGKKGFLVLYQQIIGLTIVFFVIWYVFLWIL